MANPDTVTLPIISGVDVITHAIFDKAFFLGTDSDPNDDTLSISGILSDFSRPVTSIGVDSDGNVDIKFSRPAALGDDVSFQYVVSDGHGGTATTNADVVVSEDFFS